ncbi:unnamed protein product [Lampetra planeri]
MGTSQNYCRDLFKGHLLHSAGGSAAAGPPNRRFIISYATAVAQRCCNPGEGGGYGGGAHNDGTTSFDHPLGEQAGDTALLLLTNQISESSQPQQQQPPQQQQQFYHHQQQQHQQQHQHHHHHQQQQSSTPPPVPRHQSHHYQQQQQQHQQQHHLLHPHHYQQYQQHQHHHQQQQLGGGSGGGGGGEEEALLVVCDAAPARPVSVSSGNSATAAMSAHPAGGEHDGGGAPPSPVPKNAKGSRKLQNFGKRSHSIRRNPNAPVMIRGWLHKQDSTGMKLWKKRWFVLSDFCLFYYKDNKEEGVLGSISLPSFQVNPVEADDKINRKFAFKARHAGMRTYYFGADSLEEMRVWMKAMAQASQLQMEIPQGFDPSAGPDRTPAEAADRPTAGAAISRPEAAATSGVVLRHPNPQQQQQQQPRPQQQRPLLQQQQQQLQRHSTGGLGLAGSSSLSALDQDGFGYGAAGGAGEGHRAGGGGGGAGEGAREGEAQLDGAAGAVDAVAEGEERGRPLEHRVHPDAAPVHAQLPPVAGGGGRPLPGRLHLAASPRRGRLLLPVAPPARRGRRARRADLERSVSEYKQLESDLLALRVHLEDLLSRLSFTQTEVGHQQRAQVQRDLWRIQDVMGGLGQGSWDVTTAGGGPVGTAPQAPLPPTVHMSSSSGGCVSSQPPVQLRRLHTAAVKPPTTLTAMRFQILDLDCWRRNPMSCEAPGFVCFFTVGQLTCPAGSERVNGKRYEHAAGVQSRAEVDKSQKKAIFISAVFTSLVGVVPPLSQPGQMQSTTIASYVTLRRAKSNGAKASSERPKSAMDALYPAGGPAGGAGRGKMSVEEQLERLKLNQKAAAVAAGGGGGGDLATTVTPAGGSGRAAPRRRGHTMTLDRRTILAAQSPARPASVDVSQLMKVSQRKDDLDIAELERAVQDASAPETPAQEIARLRTAGTELDGSYDPGSEVSPPRHHVLVPERYVDEDPEEPLSPLEMEARQKNVERIKAMLAKSSVQNVAPLPSPASREVAQGKVEAHVQEQERIISMSCALAAEACQRSKAVAAKLTSPTKGASPSQDASAPGGGSHFAFV